jgi:DNA invertase Pin-like site-specific DNA recombinase
MTPQNGKPCDIYVRVSKVNGREELQGPIDQERDARAYAKSRGIPLSGEVFQDLDVSGGYSEDRRPGLRKILERVRAGKSGGMIVGYSSRFSRDTEGGLSMFRELEEYGAGIYAPNLMDHFTADGEMINTFNLAIDTAYRKRKGLEIAHAKVRRILQGKPINTAFIAPGYQLGDDGHLKPNTDAPAVREAFEMRARGAGPSEIGEHLERHGVKTSRGNTSWTKTAVYALLKSRTPLGELRYEVGKQYARQIEELPPDGIVVKTNAHEPVVDIALWGGAQKPKTRAARPRGKYLLQGLLRCSFCRFLMQGTTVTKPNGSWSYYKCQRKHASGECPQPMSMPMALADDLATEIMWRAVDVEIRPQSADLTKLQETYDAADRRFKQVQSPDAIDALGDSWSETARRYREERDEAAAALGEARAQDTSAIVLDRDLWAKMDIPGRRQILATMFDCFAAVTHREMNAFYKDGGPELPQRGKNAGIRPFEFPSEDRVELGTINPSA